MYRVCCVYAVPARHMTMTLERLYLRLSHGWLTPGSELAAVNYLVNRVIVSNEARVQLLGPTSGADDLLRQLRVEQYLSKYVTSIFD